MNEPKQVMPKSEDLSRSLEIIISQWCPLLAGVLITPYLVLLYILGSLVTWYGYGTHLLHYTYLGPTCPIIDTGQIYRIIYIQAYLSHCRYMTHLSHETDMGFTYHIIQIQGKLIVLDRFGPTCHTIQIQGQSVALFRFRALLLHYSDSWITCPILKIWRPPVTLYRFGWFLSLHFLSLQNAKPDTTTTRFQVLDLTQLISYQL